MSEEWDGKVVSSTPWGPIVEMSLGDLLARKDAEIERLRADRRERIATAALQGMLANPHNSQWEPQEFFEAAVYYADGLIAELDKEETKP